MSSQPLSHYDVHVELPVEAFHHYPWAPEEIAQRMRTLWLLELVRERRLGYGKAAELAGMPKAAFVNLMARHRVSPIDFDPDEMAREFDAAYEVARP